MTGSNRPQTEPDRKANTVSGREGTMAGCPCTPHQPAGGVPESDKFVPLSPTSDGGQKRKEK